MEIADVTVSDMVKALVAKGFEPEQAQRAIEAVIEVLHEGALQRRVVMLPNVGSFRREEEHRADHNLYFRPHKALLAAVGALY